MAESRLTDTRRTAPHADDALAPDRAIVRQAAAWLARLQSGAGAEAQDACQRWRVADPRHEIAWQRMTGLGVALHDQLGNVGGPGVHAVLTQAQGRMARRGMLKGALLVAGLGLAGSYGAGPLLQTSRVMLADLRTQVGERRHMVLQDGTVLWLNTASAADILFDDKVRRVRLISGEVLIETGTDAAHRPFEVVSGDAVLRPVGTRFLVRRDGEEGALTVLEGAVDYQRQGAAAPALRVFAGQHLDYGLQGPATVVAAPAARAAWERGMLVADRMPLARFVAELSRYRRGWLHCDPAVADLDVVGVFSVDDTTASLQLLTQILPVRLDFKTRYWVSVLPAQA